MSTGSVSTAHLDYLQRAGIDPAAAAEASAPATPRELRRRWHVTGVERAEKRPPREAERREPRDRRRARLPSEDLLIGLYGYRIPLAFVVRGEGERVTVELGTWTRPAGEEGPADVLDVRHRIMRAALTGAYGSVRMERAGPNSSPLPVSGLALGIPTVKPTDPLDGALPIDRLIRALSGARWAAVVLAEPVDERVTSELRHSTIEELRRIDEAARSEQAPRPLVEHYTELLKASLKSLTSGLAVGHWRTGVYLLGDGEGYHRLASLWSGIFSGPESLPEPVRVWELPAGAELADGWALPDSPAEPGPGFYRHPLRYQTLLTSKQLAAYIHLPRLESSGFSVTAAPDFDAIPPATDGRDAVHVGDVVVRGRPAESRYGVASADLTRHVFVTGVTGAGKTNTIFRLLEQVDALGAPFMVIEPAKAEYRALLNSPELADRLQVFTPGNEAVSPFRLNPFEVPPGIPVAVHLDLLRSAFAASFGMWTPLPQVLEQCLHRIYVDRGWDITRNTNARLDGGRDAALAHPTLSDLAATADAVTKELGYEARVTADLRAALLTRIDGLRTGGKGRMLDTARSLPAELLFGRPTVLELEGMGDDDDKAFLMALLLIRLWEHRRTAAGGDGLRHLLVIEEAHRLLANVAQRGREEQANARGKAVETFTNLLAEVRAYGQGVVVADQIPVKLAPDVIKNTNLKIAHRIVAADDRKALAGAMAMDERQARALATLPRGRAAVFGEGDDAPILVQVARAKDALSQDVPDDARVAAHMESLDALAEHRAVFLPLPACAGVCDDAEAACEAARRIVEQPRFRRAFARLALSAIEDPDALDRLWPDVRSILRAERPARLDEAELQRCVAVHAAHGWAHRRGAQAGWSYAETEELAARLRAMLLDAPAGGGVADGAGAPSADGVADATPAGNAAAAAPADDAGAADGAAARQAFRSYARNLHEREEDPFPACGRVCRQDPPLCLYRHAAADLLEAGDLDAAWSAVESQADAEGGAGLRALWEVCMDAGRGLIEIADEDWPADRLEAADAAARRASLCYGQQALARDPVRLPSNVRSITHELIREAGHD